MRLSAREAALAIVRRLRERGFEAFFVGGCVRDRLLGREGYEHRNHDIATSASPDEVSRLFPRVVPVGRRFGVMLVLQDGHCVDVATFRTETGYRDGRRPTGVRFSSRREDVRRRDFTINGLLYDPLEDRLLDYVGGGPTSGPGRSGRSGTRPSASRRTGSGCCARSASPRRSTSRSSRAQARPWRSTPRRSRW